jgi:ferredoxin-NADP reductase
MALRHLLTPAGATYIGKRTSGTNTYTFRFKPNKEFSWKAGQHAMFEIPLSNDKVGRKVFSISSAPFEGEVTITTRWHGKQASEFKKALMALKKDTPIRIRGAIGPLVIKDPSKRYAFIATGIAITPFRAILAQAAEDKLATNMHLFYVGNKDHHFFKDELSDLKSRLPGLQITYIYKPERIRGHLIEETLGENLHDTTFLLAGSHKMVKSYRRTLSGLGVHRRFIKADAFLGYHPQKLQSSDTPQTPEDL